MFETLELVLKKQDSTVRISCSRLKSEAELRSVKKTQKLLTTRVYLQYSAGNFENMKNSEHSEFVTAAALQVQEAEDHG